MKKKKKSKSRCAAAAHGSDSSSQRGLKEKTLVGGNESVQLGLSGSIAAIQHVRYFVHACCQSGNLLSDPK